MVQVERLIAILYQFESPLPGGVSRFSRDGVGCAVISSDYKIDRLNAVDAVLTHPASCLGTPPRR